MDPNTLNLIKGSAGAGGGDPVYVDDVFSTYVYTGNNTTGRDIDNGIDLDGEGGLVWIKKRDTAENHVLIDTERGADNFLMSDTTDGANTTGGPVTDFNSDGFEVDNNGYVNGNNNDYVSWTFRKAPGFFDVVTYTGTGSAQNISHSLGSVPGMIIVKKVSAVDNWQVWHRSVSTGSLSSNDLLKLDDNGAKVNRNSYIGTANSSTFEVGTDGAVNGSGADYVAYIFAHDDQSFGTDGDESIIKCGSFNSGATATFNVDLGWEPQWILIKRYDGSDSSTKWLIFDVMRGLGLSSSTALFADSTEDEDSRGVNGLFPTSTGFRTAAVQWFGGGDDYVYMAIRRPHKPPEAATEVFSVDDQSSGSGSGSVSFSAPSFPIDLMIAKRASSNADWKVMDRLRGYDKALIPHDTSIESTEGYLAGFDQMSGYTVGTNGGVLNESDSVTYCFKRAPGFFDLVAYTGNSTEGRAVPHNLGVAPELMMFKCRSNAAHWYAYAESQGATKSAQLSRETFQTSIIWNNTAPSDTEFTLGGWGYNVNDDTKTYLALLFATLPGISKVGSYSGTGNDIDIDCGFTNGARFVMIKRTDAITGQYSDDWYIWNSTRGIIAGNDPYLVINETDAEVTNTDYIDPLNSGFTVTSSAPVGINDSASGANYIYLAIA